MTENRMCNSAQLRHEFLKAWIKGLKIYNLNKNMSISDRRKAIKLSADVAIASTKRNASAQWSRALMADVASRDNGNNRIFAELTVGSKLVHQKKASTSLIKCSKKVLRNHVTIARRKARKRVLPHRVRTSSIIAKKLLEKRTRVLKRLIPGGREMDEISLIREALDYIASLQVQRDVMKHVAGAAERFGLFKF